MRRILLASAAVIAIALAAPIAGAQYTDPATDAYQTQVPDASVSGAVNDPMTPQTQQSPPPTTTPDPYASTYQPQTGTYAQPSTTMPSTSVQSQTTTTGVTADTYGATTQTTTADTYGATTTQSTTTAQGAMATDTYAATATAPQQPDAVTVPVDLAETAQMAGMDGVPMTAADVCEPRSVTLAQGTSRLGRDARRHLINAADHASVCEIQRIVVHSPSGRADAVRQTLAEHDVDESRIEVQPASDDQLHMQMEFAGVAASTPQLAAMYNQLATGFAQTGAQPGAAATTGSYAPTSYQPTTTSTQPGTQPIAYTPVDSGAGAEPTTYQPVTSATPTSYPATTTTTYQSTTTDQPTSSYAPASTSVSTSTTVDPMTGEPVADPAMDDGTP